MHVLRRSALIAGSVALFAAAPLATVAAFGGTASAGSRTTVGVVCSGLRGSYNPFPPSGTLSGCRGGTARTGTLSDFVTSPSFVMWSDGNITDYNVTSLTLGTACPKGAGTYDITGTVTSSTEPGALVGDTVSMVICDSLSGKLTNLKGTTLNF